MTNKRQECWTNRTNTHTHPHSCPYPRTLRAGRNKREKRGKNELRGLTRTLANLSSSSPGSGMGSFRGMLCPLKSGCCSMLPAFPMVPTPSNFSPPPLVGLLLSHFCQKKGERNLHGVSISGEKSPPTSLSLWFSPLADLLPAHFFTHT